MIALVEGASRQKTPNEIALNILLAGLTIIFLLATVTLQPFAIYSGRRAGRHRPRRPAGVPDPHHDRRPAVGHRHRRHGPPGAAQRAGHVRPGRRGGRRLLDAAARQDRHHHPRQPPGGRVPARSPGSTRSELAEAAQLSSLADETPEGRSIVVLAKERFGLRERELSAHATLVPFTAQTRMSGRRPRTADVGPQGRRRLGAPLGAEQGGSGRRARLRRAIVEGSPPAAAPPLVVAERRRASVEVLGVVHLKDVVKQGMRRALRPAAGHGHPHGDDHRRQPAHGQGHRRRGRRRRLPRRGHARGQDGPDPQGAGRAAASWP